MTKAILIDPGEVRRRGVLTGPEIPLNAYVPDPAAEADKFGADGLVRIYRDMVIIREFETMLDRIKKEGVYHGIEYNHKGPAHLSIGQEVGRGGAGGIISARTTSSSARTAATARSSPRACRPSPSWTRRA